jgi:hypothetical protein
MAVDAPPRVTAADARHPAMVADIRLPAAGVAMRRLAVTVVVDPPTVVAGAGDHMVAVAAADTGGDIAPDLFPA